jgi:hypothetical protein
MQKFLFLVLAWLSLFAGKTNDDVRALLKADRLSDAFALSEERAAAGDPEGDQSLAWFYDTGKHVAKDKVRAAEHFRKCADAGLKHCQWRLGVMLDVGDGIPTNVGDAFNYLSASARQEYGLAHASLGLMYATGRGTVVDYKKSMESYRTAARLGEAHGFFGVGVLYNLGQGVPKDRLRSFAWFLVAHFQGDEQGQKAMDNVGKDFSEDELKQAVEIANEIMREFNLQLEDTTGIVATSN